MTNRRRFLLKNAATTMTTIVSYHFCWKPQHASGRETLQSAYSTTPSKALMRSTTAPSAHSTTILPRKSRGAQETTPRCRTQPLHPLFSHTKKNSYHKLPQSAVWYFKFLKTLHAPLVEGMKRVDSPLSLGGGRS